MFIKSVCTVLLVFSSLTIVSQENLYSSSTIPENLKKSANAVVRLNDIDVSLESSKKMVIKKKSLITVLNKEGDDNIDAYVFYDDDVHIKELEVLVYNKFGDLIKKIKEKDFKDISAVDGGTLYSDSRVKYLEYTPIDYPYTLEFTCETETGNTAFIPPFSPITDYFVSVETSKYTLNYPEDITIRKKEKNLEGFQFEKEDTIGKLVYKVKNIEVYKPEDYSPSFRNIIPKVLLAANQFTYEEVYASVDDWNSMGIWFQENLLNGRNHITEETKKHILKLVEGIDDPIEKAKIVYKYVQDNTRYISVQVGIGGMQPISALEVDKVKYGDCKGLTNYTKSLLEVVGVNSNYTRLYASPSSQISVDKDFVSFGGQTNHVILNIPQENQDDIWLECTSQKVPFGFIGEFTDDRDVLVVTPEGGKIKHTKKYTTNENSQTIEGSFALSDDGTIDVTANVVSKGIQYDNKYWIETETARDLDVYYKKRWSYINNITINKKDITNNKDSVALIENIKFLATNYSKKVGDRMLFNVNALNRNTNIPDRYRARKYPLKINRGFIDVDEVEIKLPKSYKVEALPNKVVIENKFGHYKEELTVKDEKTLIYKREFMVNDGEFPKEDYNGFRNFYKEVTKQDNSKVALIKI
ncbi:DUF3857 domain-containing protein [Yeosuana marina]|uniref:DUF3857 domain-containing protein n=1 Tax=Yeosuana marina TaxID=1565536 RepID=UPI00141E2630|nr:DUF3857 domain-containing protein [Yeosuana marina]